MDFTDPRLPGLYAKRKEIAEQISEIEEAEIAPMTASLLGKCYRYRNCYSLPEDESDYWWLYAKVIKVDGRYLTTFQFQRDKDGRVTIEPENSRFWNMGGYEEITPEAFRKAWHSILTEAATDFPDN